MLFCILQESCIINLFLTKYPETGEPVLGTVKAMSKSQGYACCNADSRMPNQTQIRFKAWKWIMQLISKSGSAETGVDQTSYGNVLGTRGWVARESLRSFATPRVGVQPIRWKAQRALDRGRNAWRTLRIQLSKPRAKTCRGCPWSTRRPACTQQMHRPYRRNPAPSYCLPWYMIKIQPSKLLRTRNLGSNLTTWRNNGSETLSTC